jgi:hypothetical protein
VCVGTPHDIYHAKCTCIVIDWLDSACAHNFTIRKPCVLVQSSTQSRKQHSCAIKGFKYRISKNSCYMTDFAWQILVLRALQIPLLVVLVTRRRGGLKRCCIKTILAPYSMMLPIAKPCNSRTDNHVIQSTLRQQGFTVNIHPGQSLDSEQHL